jgi:hypothetical protein
VEVAVPTPTRSSQLCIEVPAADQASLDALRASVQDQWVVDGLDGESVVQIILLLNITTYRLLRTWILSRNDRVKNVKLVWNGKEFTGLSQKEISALLDRMAPEGSTRPALELKEAAEGPEQEDHEN